MNFKTRTRLTAITATIAGLALAPAALAAPHKPVKPPKATALKVAAPASAGVGAPFDAKVTAVTKQGKRVKEFRGAVSLTAGDGATVPAAHRFTKADGGRFVFRGLELARPGDVDVVASSGKLTGRDSVAVSAGQVASIDLSTESRGYAGDSFEFHVTGTDARGNDLGDLTNEATVTMPDGQCQAGYCASNKAGVKTVTAKIGNATDESQVEIMAGFPQELQVTPDSSRAIYPAAPAGQHADYSKRNDVQLDDSRRYTVLAWDAFGNPLGNVTSEARISVDGVPCPNGVCTAKTPGTHEVSVVEGVRASSTLTVAGYEDSYRMYCTPHYADGKQTPRWFDMNADMGDGCETENPLYELQRIEWARDLGTKSCWDDASKIDETATLMRDARGQSSVVYMKVKAKGEWSCQNDTVLDVETSGGVDEECIKAGTWFGGDRDEIHTHETMLGGNDRKRIADGLYYQSGSNVYISFKSTCGGPGTTQVRVTGHL